MALEINRAAILALQLGRTKDEWRLRAEHMSMGKLFVTFRGAADVHARVIGEALTGIQASR